MKGVAPKGAVDRSRPPEPEPLRRLRLPDFRRETLDNGMTLWMGRDRQIPEVSVRLVVEAGALTEPEGRTGAAELTGRLLSEGTEERSALEMAEWLDRLGAGFSASVGYDAALLSVHSLPETLDGALDYLRAAAREPVFPREEVERVRGELVDELKRERDEADVVADHALIRAVYGPHRYGIPSAGTPEELAGLERGDVLDFYDRNYGPRDAAVVVYGDVDPDRAREALSRRFSGWAGGDGHRDVAAPDPSAARAGEVLVVDRPQSAQAEIRVGAVGLAYADEDFFPSLVGNAVLGGLFNSRVNMNLREEKGWTYGAFSTFHFRRAPGPFVGRAAVETQAAGAALEEFMGEVRGMWEEPPGDEELELAKNALVLSLPRKFETASQVSRKVATEVIYGLPEDYWERYPERVQAVDRADVVEAFRRRLAPETLVCLVVVDAEAVLPDLRRRFDAVDVVPPP